MAQTQTQQKKDSVKTVRLPLIGAYSNRDTSPNKDQRFVNMFPETRKVEAIESTKIVLQKRPGLTHYKNFGTGEGRGIAYFKDLLYIALGNVIIKDGTPPTAIITMTTSTGHVGFQLGNSSIYGDYLFVCDGINGWVIKQDGTILTMDNTSLRKIYITAGGSGYTNGTYTLGLSGGGGSGAAGTYTVSGNVVTSATLTSYGTGYSTAPTVSFPSGGGTGATGLAYINDFPSPHSPYPTFIDGYILLPQRSDIYNCVLDEPDHWDAGEYLTAEMFPDTVVALSRQNNQVVVFGESSIEFFYDAANTSGSPLARNDAAAVQIGCVFPNAIYQNENSCIYVGQSDSGGRAIWQITAFTPKKISDEYIEKIIDAETNPNGVYGFGVRTLGHLFYLLNLPTLNRTFLYDVDEKLWHEWSSNSAGSHSIFAYNCMTDTQSGKGHLLHKSNGTIYIIDPTVYTDAGTTILCEIVTNKFDFNTYKRKFYSGLRIVGDRYASGTTADVTWTDDDYQTWSNTKTITLTDDYPAFQRLGSSRRRAFKVRNTQDTAFRLESIEVDYAEGDT